MAAKYNTTFSCKRSEKYRSSQFAICAFNKKVLQILRTFWVQTEVMGTEPTSHVIKCKRFLRRWRWLTQGWGAQHLADAHPFVSSFCKARWWCRLGDVSCQCSLPPGSNSLHSCLLQASALLHPCTEMPQNLGSCCSCLNTQLGYGHSRFVFKRSCSFTQLLCLLEVLPRHRWFCVLKNTDVIEIRSRF